MLKQSCKSQQNNTVRAATRGFCRRYVTKFWPLPHHLLFSMLRPSLGVVYKQRLHRAFLRGGIHPFTVSWVRRGAAWKELASFSEYRKGS